LVTDNEAVVIIVVFINALLGVFREEEEGDGVRSGPGEARTILLLHIISARPSKQPDDDRSFIVLTETKFSF
jgi:hypothetical protein